MSMDEELKRIRKLAGLTEAQEIIPPTHEDDEQARQDAETDMRFDRQIAIEKVYKQKYLVLCQKAGLTDLESIDVDIDSKTNRVEIDLVLNDVEVSIGVLAKLSEVGAITLESMVKAFGNSITISTVEQLNPQDMQTLQGPPR